MRYMVIEVLTLVMSIVAIIAATIGTMVAISAKIEVEAQKRSTHSVQLVPVDQLGGVKTDSDEARDKLAKEGPQTAQIFDLVDDSF
jgi:hypothetical protein